MLGKPLGILLATVVAVKTGVARLPEGCGWVQMAGIGVLAGIGFTMSLFIGGLAFPDQALQEEVRVGVVTGSLISTLLGIAILFAGSSRAKT